MNSAPELTAAIRELVEQYGAHLVLYYPDRYLDGEFKPTHRGWPDRPATADEVDKHLANYANESKPILGIIPASLGLTGLDWDHSDQDAAGRFLAEHPTPLCYPTRRGWHFLYPDDEPRGQPDWYWQEAEEKRGEVRSDRGFLFLHGGAAQLLLRWMRGDYSKARVTRFEQVLSHIDGNFASNVQPRKSTAKSASSPKSVASESPDSADSKATNTTVPIFEVQWESLIPSQRNVTLFNHLRHLARSKVAQPAITREQFNMDIALAARAADHAIVERGPSSDGEPWTTAEALGVARSVTRYWWPLRGTARMLADVSSETQARRGRQSGTARRHRNIERDNRIRQQRFVENRTYRDIAAAAGIALSTTWDVCQRTRAQSRRLDRDARQLVLEQAGKVANTAWMRNREKISEIAQTPSSKQSNSMNFQKSPPKPLIGLPNNRRCIRCFKPSGRYKRCLEHWLEVKPGRQPTPTDEKTE